MRRPIYFLALVALCMGSCSPPSPKQAIAYNFELIGISASEDSAESAAQAARMTSKGLGMHRRNSNFQTDTKPDDYMVHYGAFQSAWWDAAQVFPKDVNLATFLKSPAADREIDLATLDPVQRKQAEALRKIDAAYAEMVKSAAGYGVEAPPHWLSK